MLLVSTALAQTTARGADSLKGEAPSGMVVSDRETRGASEAEAADGPTREPEVGDEFAVEAETSDEDVPEAEGSQEAEAKAGHDAAAAQSEAGGEAKVDNSAPTEASADVEPATDGAVAAADNELEATDDDVVVESLGGGLFEQGFESSPDEGAQAAEPGTPRLDFGGYVRGDLFMGKVPGRSTSELKAAYAELAFNLRALVGASGDAFAEVRLRQGQQGDEQGLALDLREAYVNAYWGVLDLRVGQQIIVWGRADGFNPTNNLTPMDLRVRSPMEDDRRMANVGVRSFLNWEPLRLEGVWMPIYRATELPSVDYPEYVTAGDPDYPEAEFPHGLGAARAHLLFPSFEASVSYLYGYSPLPGLALLDFTVGEDPPSVRLSRTAYRHQVVGFDFSTAIGDELAVRGEVAYRRPFEPERTHTPRSDLQYVLGADRSFGSLNVIAQYIGRYAFDWERAEAADASPDPMMLSSLNPPLSESVMEGITGTINRELAARNQMLFQQLEEVQHLASIRVEWLALHETLSLSALGVLNITTEEWLVYPKIAYQIDDQLSTSVGAEIYVGPEDTLFGFIDEQLSAGYAELRYSF